MVESLDGTRNIEKTSSPHIDLREFNEEELLDFINGPLLEIENRKYTAGNTAEHKFLFLLGGPEGDVAAATIKGKPVYTKLPIDSEGIRYPKAPEIDEVKIAISAHFELKHNVTRVISEITDIFYNLSHLMVLDRSFKDAYKNCMIRLSKSLGLPLRDILYLTAEKYKHRHIVLKKKDSEEEDKVIADLINEKTGVVTAPSNASIAATYGEIHKIANNVIKKLFDNWRFLMYDKVSIGKDYLTPVPEAHKEGLVEIYPPEELQRVSPYDGEPTEVSLITLSHDPSAHV